MATRPIKKPAVDPEGLPERIGATAFPEPFRSKVAGRIKKAIGDAVGLTSFGVNLTSLEPGAWSAPRHWHSRQDELIYILDGEVTLITDEGEQVLTAGMAAGFPAGKADAHHLINHTNRRVSFLEIGDRTADDEVTWPDEGLKIQTQGGKRVIVRRDGTLYP